MADNFDLMATALKAVCPNNEILLDNAGKPSVMVRIPKMTYAQLGMGECWNARLRRRRNTTKRLPCRIWMWKWQSCGLICG